MASLAFAIKAAAQNPSVKTFTFTAHKTMYGGKHVAEGDTPVVMPQPAEHLILPRADEVSGLADAQQTRARSR